MKGLKFGKLEIFTQHTHFLPALFPLSEVTHTCMCGARPPDPCSRYRVTCSYPRGFCLRHLDPRDSVSCFLIVRRGHRFLCDSGHGEPRWPRPQYKICPKTYRGGLNVAFPDLTSRDFISRLMSRQSEERRDSAAPPVELIVF